MIPAICLISTLLPAGAPPLAPQGHDQSGTADALRERVVAALLDYRVTGFEGTVTFEKEFGFPPRNGPVMTPADAAGYSRQRWEITTDGRALVCRIELLEGSNVDYPVFAGEDSRRIWRTLGRELHVYEKNAFERAEQSDRSGLEGTRQIVAQAKHELEKIFSLAGLVGSAPDVDRQVVSAVENGHRVQAIVRGRDGDYTVRFATAGDRLIPVSMHRREGRAESKWSFSEHFSIGDRTTPGTIAWTGKTEDGKEMTVRTSRIQASRAENRSDFAKRLQFPDRAEGRYAHLILSNTVNRRGVVSRSLAP